MKTFPTVAYAVAASFVLAGCATGPSLPTQYFQPTRGQFAVVNTPQLEAETTAELGQPLISRSNSLATPAIRLTQSVSFPTQNNGISSVVQMAAGTFKKVGENAGGEYFKAPIMTSTVSVFGSSNVSALEGGVYIPKNAVWPVTAYWMATNLPNGAFTTPMAAKVERIPNIIEVSPENFRRELVYTGVSKNIITVLYREFANDMARPAFTQELKYDLGEGRTIGFKGARFEVLKATNVGITYRVLRNLD